MRKPAGIVLIGLGVIALLAALVVRTWVEPNAVKLPTDTKVNTKATGTASGIDLATNQPFTNIPVTATRELTTDKKASDDDVAVWSMKVKLTDPTGNALTSYTDRIAVDRDNAKAVNKNKYGEKITDDKFGERKVTHKGLSYHFPFDTKKKTYDFFDANTGKAFPAKYDGEKKIDGIKTYHFVQNVPATKLREVQIPGVTVGSPAPTVTLDVFYTNKRDIWVEPTSGWIVKADEAAKTSVRVPGTNVDAMTILDTKLAFTDDTVDDLVDTAKDDRDKITLVKKTIPVTLLIAGVVLLVAGVLLLKLRGAPKPGKHSSPEE